MKQQFSIKNWLLSSKYISTALIAWKVFFPCYFFAQNLVPNYSFEYYTSCPVNGGEIYKAYPWFWPDTLYSSSAEYFNSCSQTYNVPNNGQLGYQNAKMGVGYAGIILYYDSTSEYREYIEVRLDSPLVSNKKYCVEFYISLADGSKYGIDAVHLLLSNDSLLGGAIQEALPYEPQIKNTSGIITDTANWTLISGEYVASGGEQFLTIGNFYKNDSTQVAISNTSSPFGYWGYYYIDDVSVTLCNDTVSVEEKATVGSWQLAVYPNPANSSFTITAKGGDEIIITDITGRKIREYKLSGNQLKIKLDEYDDGIYFLILLKNNSIVTTEKLVVIK